MGKAVEHTAAGSQARDGLAVVFLVEEEAGLLAVFDVDLVENTVFTDFRKAGAEKARRLRIAAVFGGQRIPAFVLGKPFKLADGDVVALVNPPDFLAVFGFSRSMP